MADREGGGGVVGEPHSNSEEQQTETYGRPDSNCSGPTKILIHCAVLNLHVDNVLCLNFCITSYFLYHLI